MNYKLMFRMLGRTLQVEALCLLAPMVVCLIYGEDLRPFLATFFLVVITGTLLARLHSKSEFFSREGITVVGLIWLVLSLFGALPFWLSETFPSFADCFFEIVSGFTTSGATILTDIERLPKGILFWRSLSSWIGGMGVLLFTLAFLPKVGGRTQVLVQAEVPGPVAHKLVPKTVQSSKILYYIYFVFSGVEVLAFRVAGMPWYDAIVTTFASVCTGGFGVRNTSFAAYNSTCQLIAIVFMILGSLNFALFFLILTGRTKQAFASDEMKFFLGVVVVVSLLVFCDILPGYDSPLTALKDAVFQVSSVISTSGFSTVDYAQWPTFSQTLLVMLMFLGGCAGSTAGGMKCSRILLLLRCAKRSVLRLNHPRSVKVVKLDGKVVDEDVLTTVYSYSICFFLLLGAGSVILSLDGFSLTTTLSAALACLTNVGPGLGQVGPALSYAIFSAPCKYLLSLFMLVGRLEIFPILLLFLPSTWRKS